jgi:hypothetical protein
MWGVSNYFFLVGFGVVAPETCLESRCLKRKQFERMSQEELLLRHSRIRRKGAPDTYPISFITVTPAFLASSSNSRIAGET